MEQTAITWWILVGLFTCAIWAGSLVHFVGLAGSAAIVLGVALLGLAAGRLDRTSGPTRSS